MKKIFIACALLAFFACSTEKTPESIHIDTKPHQLSIGTTSINFGARTDLSKSVSVTAENVGWEFSNIPTSWLLVDPSSGSASATVRLTATENTSVDETRIHVMQLHSTKTDYAFSRDISVSQSAATIYINPKETSYGCEAASNSKIVEIDANVEWEVKTLESWVQLVKNSNRQLTITVEENIGISRNAVVSFYRSGTTETISTLSITQSEANVTSNTDLLVFDVNGESKKVTIDAGASWTAYTSDPSWLIVTPTTGQSGVVELTASAAPNTSSTSRNGFVFVNIGDNTKLSIPVQQDKMSISIEGTSKPLNSSGQNAYQLTVISTSSWELISKPEWLLVNFEKGDTGSTIISISAEQNPSIHSRSGNLKIGIPNTSIYAEVEVEQDGVETGNQDLYFTWTASQQNLEIPFPNEWSAMVSGDWLTLSQYSGIGTCKITVSAALNNTEDDRTASIVFITENNSFTVTAHQEGQYLKIDKNDALISAMGGIVNIAVRTTVGATESIEYVGDYKDWIKMDKSTPNSYTLSVDANSSKYSRTAIFRILPTQASTNIAAKSGVKLEIMQEGRSIKTNVKKIAFFSKGGTSSVYTIQADGDYTMQKEPSDTWYLIQHDTQAKTFTLVASENSTSNTREGRLTLSLTGLPTGENYSIVIPVVQYNSGLHIDFEDFGEEKDLLDQ